MPGYHAGTPKFSGKIENVESPRSTVHGRQSIVHGRLPTANAEITKGNKLQENPNQFIYAASWTMDYRPCNYGLWTIDYRLWTMAYGL